MYQGDPIHGDQDDSFDSVAVLPLRACLVHINDLLITNKELLRFESKYSQKEVSVNTSDFKNVEDAANDKDTNQKFLNLNIPCNDQSINVVACHRPIESDSPPIAEMEQQAKKITESGKPKHKVSAKGNKGFLKTLILDGLKDFFETKNKPPEQGKAFNEFLFFIYSRFYSESRPDYFAKVSSIIQTVATDKGNCICENKGKSITKWHSRKYVENRFSEYRKESPYIDGSL